MEDLPDLKNRYNPEGKVHKSLVALMLLLTLSVFTGCRTSPPSPLEEPVVYGDPVEADYVETHPRNTSSEEVRLQEKDSYDYQLKEKENKTQTDYFYLQDNDAKTTPSPAAEEISDTNYVAQDQVPVESEFTDPDDRQLVSDEPEISPNLEEPKPDIKALEIDFTGMAWFVDTDFDVKGGSN